MRTYPRSPLEAGLGRSLLLTWWLISLSWAHAQPIIVSVVPTNMDADVSSNASVVFTFSETMDTNATIVQFMDTSAMQTLDAKTAWNAGDTVVTCTPANPWPIGHLILWIADGTTPDGTSLSGTVSGRFTAAASTPVTSSSEPPPASLAASMLTVTVTNGCAPFASSGTYFIFISPQGNTFNVLGPAGPLSSGSCDYWVTATNGQAALADDFSGVCAALNLSFASPTNGTVALTNARGFQTGSFTLVVYADLSPPELSLPTLSNGQFQCYLSGQPGCGYTVDTSSDLANWQPLVSMALADWATNFADMTTGGVRFYRARLSATAFAPGNLTNKTFNMTITSGALPLATNGICQWMADTNDNGYQVLGGPGTTDSSGTYSYTVTGLNSALLSLQDSGAGALSQQLFFTSPEAGYFYSSNATGYEAGSFTMDDGPVLFLGNVAFTPDTNHANTLSFAADGLPDSLSVTNAAGWVWTLNLPGDALIDPETITMTPFANVDARNSVVPIQAGVQLLPDGLQFYDGVTLTVTAPYQPGRYATLLMGNSDGSGLNFAPTASQANTYSTTLFHFSSGAMSDPPAPPTRFAAEAQRRRRDSSFDKSPPVSSLSPRLRLELYHQTAATRCRREVSPKANRQGTQIPNAID
jgi:hypothetical protein